MVESQLFVLIDGHAIIHRAYHAYPKTLTTRSGELVNAVYGFTSILFSIFKELHPEYVVASFDLKGPTFRHKEFADYKITRPKVDEELIGQINRVKEVVKALNIPIFEVAGYEADDVIGTLVKKALALRAPKALEVVIASGDRDILQLLDKNVVAYFPARGKMMARIIREDVFKKEYGFNPIQLIDYKALAGDASDNIPGVKGIGPKKAAFLVQKFGSIEKLYQHLNGGKDLATVVAETGLSKLDVEKLKNSQAQAELSKKLATIVTDVPIRLKLQACKLSDYDEDKVAQLFQKLEFRTLINRLPGHEQVKEKKKEKLKKKNNQQMALF